MIDIHCHIMPGFDDGAASLNDALKMARIAVSSGVRGIAVTPHFPGNRESLASLNRMVQQYKARKQAVKNAGIPLQLCLGAEILCLPETVDMARSKQLPTLGNTNYLLTEFYFDESYAQMDTRLAALADCGYRPVIAHPERYEAVQRDPRILEDWFRKGYVIQLNKGSILGAFGAKPERTATLALQYGLAHVIASDAHSPHRRTTDMGQVRDVVRRQFGPEYAALLLAKNRARLVRGEAMVPTGETFSVL